MGSWIEIVKQTVIEALVAERNRWRQNHDFDAMEQVSTAIRGELAAGVEFSKT